MSQKVFAIDQAMLDSSLTKFKKIFANTDAIAESSIQIVRLSDGKPLASLQANQLLIPASVTKLITAAASFHYWSSTKTFNTRLFHSGEFKNGVISGNLYVVGDGDPLLISEKLWQMAADIRQQGVQQIRGNIIVDGSLFDDEAFDVSRLEGLERSAHAYDAPTSAVGVNFNAIAITIAPGPTLGKMARVSIDPVNLEHVRIVNLAKTVRGDQKSVGAERTIGKDGRITITATGLIGTDAKAVKVYRSGVRPLELAGEYVRGFLRHEGIQIMGKVIAGSAPQNTRLLYEVEGYPLTRIVEGLSKYSNNYIADVLTKRLGAEFASGVTPLGPKSGSLSNGRSVLQKFLRDTVKIKDSFELRNGSGLDVENRLSAQQLTAVLAWTENRFDFFPELLASLPSAGLDGTLKKRFKNDSEEILGRVRAKTGTLTEPVTVASLAGYFRHPREGLCAFAILQNGKQGRGQPSLADLQKFQDDLLLQLLRSP